MPPKKRAAPSAAAKTSPRRSSRAVAAASASGRPKRTAAGAMATTEEPKSKRSKAAATEDAKTNASEGAAAPKRRGRPAKAASAVTEAAQEVPPPAAKRGRGRPAKKQAAEPAEDAPIAAPASRGRPAKKATSVNATSAKATAAKATKAKTTTKTAATRRGRSAPEPEDLPIGEQTQQAEANEQLQEELDQAVESEMAAAPKRRGRPPKVKPETTTAAKATAAKTKATSAVAGKKRGRAAVDENATKEETGEAEESGRGKRARKSTAQADEPAATTTTSSTSKTRGRPAKSVTSAKPATAAAAAAPPTTKKRGRPAKSQTPAEKAEVPQAAAAESKEEEKDDPTTAATPAPKKKGRKSKAPAESAEKEAETTASKEPAAAKGKKRKSEAVPATTEAPAKRRSRKSAPAQLAAGDGEEATTVGSVEMTDEFGRHFWLMKAEPESRMEKGKDVKFSIDDLQACSVPEPWTGVRNPAARNNMQAMQVGDLAFFYHSSCKVPGVAGIMEIVHGATVDETAFDEADPYYDEKSDPEKPKWYNVHVEFRQKMPNYLSLPELKKHQDRKLSNMQLFKQTRLSVSKVSKPEWDFIMELCGAKPVPPSDKAPAPRNDSVAEKKENTEKKKSSSRATGFLSTKSARRGSRSASMAPALQTPAATSKRASSAQPTFTPATAPAATTLASVTEDTISGAVPPAFVMRSSPPAPSTDALFEKADEAAAVIEAEQAISGAEEDITMEDFDAIPAAPELPVPSIGLAETPVEEAMRNAQADMESSTVL